MSQGPPYDQPESLPADVQKKLDRISEFMEERSMIPQPLERVWLLRMEQKQGGPDGPRRAVEGVALSEEDARLWEAESGEYRNTAEQVPVWRPAMMMVSGDVDLDDPGMAEAMEDIRQAGARRLTEDRPSEVKHLLTKLRALCGSMEDDLDTTQGGPSGAAWASFGAHWKGLDRILGEFEEGERP